jgi:hypothetical protein
MLKHSAHHPPTRTRPGTRCAQHSGATKTIMIYFQFENGTTAMHASTASKISNFFKCFFESLPWFCFNNDRGGTHPGRHVSISKTSNLSTVAPDEQPTWSTRFSLSWVGTFKTTSSVRGEYEHCKATKDATT